MKRIAAFLALTAITAPAFAAKPCLTPDEADAVMTVALPGIVTGTADRCAAGLPRDAFLIERGPALADRYRREGQSAWPRARGVMTRLGGSAAEGLLSGFGEAGQRAAVDGFVGAAIAERLSEDRCVAADAMLELIEPLPTLSIGRIATLLLAVATEDGESNGLPFRICATGTS